MSDPVAPLSVSDTPAYEPVPPSAGDAVAEAVAGAPPAGTPEGGDVAPVEDDPGAVPPAPDAPADDEEAAGSRRDLPIDAALGVVRLGVGAALVVAPRWAGRIWVGPGADGPGSLVFARALGARDVALGVRILDGVRKGEPVAHWVSAGFAADVADVAATMIAGRHLSTTRRVVMPLVAGAVGALGVWSGRRSGG